ncbi:GAP family protein [Actinacidiphila acidipaludis]|uniref:GAP family protein n=1 Tax=Actinacidiphila acidipaludis TaxID=2873382 RepID=A0ABS7QAY8_9ACTN|nr:GAP family protein [Streptomyces acidipaludis]MBY8878954.1 GAP family protein [Streptomyces acidipaludis]
MVTDLLIIGLAITLGPLHNTAFILLLSSKRGVRNGLAFILAWLAMLVLLIAFVVTLTGGNPPKHHSASSTAELAIKLAIGVGMVAFAEYRRRRRGGGQQKRRKRRTPKWQTRLDQVSPWMSAALGVLLQPWGAVVAGAATVAEADLSSAATWAALVGYCLLATSSLLAMELYTTFRPAAAKARLEGVRRWIDQHQEQALVSLSLALGLWLMGKSIYGLVG